MTIGTPFMAPEQVAARRVTPATAIFALGRVAASSQRRAPPAFGEDTGHGVRYRIAHEEPDLTALPEQLRELVTRYLAKDPEARPTIAEVIGLCRSANAETALRRPEDWLPGAVAADTTVRAAAPAPVKPRRAPRP